jgi:soluble lytic murein transglycosylase-like protein
MVFLVTSILCQANDICKEHPIYCQIVKNKTNIDKNYAMELSNIIHNLARVYNIKPYRLAAILAHESGYKLDAINTKSLDYGISQINHKTIEAYGFDKERLLTDLEYSVKAGAMVLADFKRSFGHRELDYWCRYNVGTAPKHKIQDNCEIYKTLVARYM